MANSSRMLIAPVCLLLLLHFADIILGHFGAGGPPQGGWGAPPSGGPPQGGWGAPPSGGPPQGAWGAPPAPPSNKGGSSEGVWKLPKGGIDLGDIGKGMFDWFGGKGGKPPNQEDAKKMGITKPPPPASLPPACPFSSLIKTPPVSPVWQQCASTPPPSLQNIDKSKCTCQLLPSCVDSLCKMDVNKLALGVKVTPDKPNPTLLDSCNAKYKGKPDLDKPPVKVLSNCVGQTDLVGLKTCHDSLQSGQVQNVKDLVLNLKQNSPGNYVVLSNLIVGLQADYNSTVNCMGDKTANMVNTFIANLKAGLDVNVAYQNCMATPDKGSIVDLFGAINQTYPKLADTLSLGPPPAATTPAPSGVFPLPWAAPPPTPSPAPSSMPPCLQPILVDLQNKCKNESDMKDLLGQLNLDCDANVQSVCQKTKEKCPDPLAKMLVQVQPSDLDGLSVLVNAILSGSITTGDQFTSQLQSQCPGLFNFAVSVTANIKLTLNVFWSALQDPQLQLMTKLEQPVSNTCLQIKDKVQSNSQPLKDAVKKSVPGAQPLMDTNLNVSDCGLSLGNAINAKIPDPTACQNVLNALQPNPTALDSLFVKIQGSFSAKLKILLGKLQGTDVDGLSLVLSDAAANKFSTWDQFTAELKTKCPGFMELVLMFWNVLKVFFNELDSTLLDLLKQIGQLLLDLLNSLIQILLQANPDDIGKILDAIIKAMPSSEPIVNGIKMYINIQIKITVNGSVSPPPLPSPPPPTPPPPPPTLPPPPPTTTEFVCPAEGAWGPWQPTGQCSDTCGNCGTLIQQRECQGVASCPCLGPKTQVVRCNPSPCAYPRRSCCVGTAQTGCKG